MQTRLNIKYKIIKEVEENISEYVYNLEDIELSKYDTSPKVKILLNMTSSIKVKLLNDKM